MSLKGIPSAILSYRLKYSIQHQYPGKWTTPIVLIFFTAVTVVLAFLNISLAGQDIVQDSTVHPNDTSFDLPFSAFIPSPLRPSAGEFTPATFKLGETLRTNMSLFEYEIVEAYDDNGRPVTSFPWYNNPLSSCDVGEIRMNFPPDGWFLQLDALITCWFPSNLTLAVTFTEVSRDTTWPLGFVTKLMTGTDLIWHLKGSPKIGLHGVANLCCHCSSFGNFTPETEPHLGSIYSGVQTEMSGPWWYKSVAHPACDDSVPARISYQLDLNIQDLPPFEAIIHNTFQSFYHLLRLDLGVMMPNQIFTSPEVFNKTIITRPLQEWIDATFPSTVEWKEFWASPTLPPVPQDIQDATLDVAVPKAVYLQPRFRPKPLPSAITSVFVATITMVATIWKVFSVIAGFFVDSTLDDLDRTRSVEMMEKVDGFRVELTRRGTV